MTQIITSGKSVARIALPVLFVIIVSAQVHEGHSLSALRNPLTYLAAAVLVTWLVLVPRGAQ